MSILNYNGYTGTVEVCMDNQCLHGKVLFIHDLVTYEAETPKDIHKAFIEAVDDYLETCKELGRQPQKPCSGQFNVRISPELHKSAIIKAAQREISLNALVVSAVEQFVSEENKYYDLNETIKSTVTNVTTNFIKSTFSFDPRYVKQSGMTAAPKAVVAPSIQVITLGYLEKAEATVQ